MSRNKQYFGRVLTTWFFLLGSLALAEQFSPSLPDSAICTRCSVFRGYKLLQPVAAASRYKEKTYFFCSEECKAQFDNNPEFYVEMPLPRPAPEFKLANLNGKLDSLSRYNGKLVLIDFWATWCAPCVKSMRDLESIHQAYPDDSLVILGVTLDSLGSPKVLDHVTKHQITYAILFDSREQPAWLAFGAKSVPSLYLVDRQGNIVCQWRGAAEKSEITAALRKLFDQSALK